MRGGGRRAMADSGASRCSQARVVEPARLGATGAADIAHGLRGVDGRGIWVAAVLPFAVSTVVAQQAGSVLDHVEIQGHGAACVSYAHDIRAVHSTHPMS